MFEEFPKCDPETRSEHTLLEKNGTKRLAGHSIATNLQFVKNTVSAKHNKTRRDCAFSVLHSHYPSTVARIYTPYPTLRSPSPFCVHYTPSHKLHFPFSTHRFPFSTPHTQYFILHILYFIPCFPFSMLYGSYSVLHPSYSILDVPFSIFCASFSTFLSFSYSILHSPYSALRCYSFPCSFSILFCPYSIQMLPSYDSFVVINISYIKYIVQNAFNTHNLLNIIAEPSLP